MLVMVVLWSDCLYPFFTAVDLSLLDDVNEDGLIKDDGVGEGSSLIGEPVYSLFISLYIYVLYIIRIIAYPRLFYTFKYLQEIWKGHF